MITKKLGKITFGWNEAALNGKGWWYVVGKNDSFSRAASKTEVTKLGRPKESDVPPKDVGKPRYYYDISKQGKPIRRRMRTGSGYEEADITASKGLMQLASEKLLSGQSLGSSLKGAVKDKMAARTTNIKKAFDPMNILSKVPAVGMLAAAAYGMKRGRAPSDISYFTGVHAPDSSSTASKIDTSPETDLSGESASGVLEKIYKLLEQQGLERQIEKSFMEEQAAEEERRHKELIDALLKGISPKGKGKSTTDVTPKKGLFDNIMDALSSPILRFATAIAPVIASMISLAAPLAAVVASVVGASKLIDKAYEFLTGKSSDTYNKLYDKNTPEDIKKGLDAYQRSGESEQARARKIADFKKQLKEKGKVTDIMGKDITAQAKKQIGEYDKIESFKTTDPYQQYRKEVLMKDYKGGKRPTFEEWSAGKGTPTPAAPTVTPPVDTGMQVMPAPVESPAPTPSVLQSQPKKSTASKLLVPNDTIVDAMRSAAKRIGVDFPIMMAMAKQESGFNPNAKASTSSATGLFQFIKSTWNNMVAKYGKQFPELYAGPQDVNASSIAGALYIKENTDFLKKNDIPVNGTNLYASHFLGAGGAKKLLTANPNDVAATLLPQAAAANKNIFYDKDRPRTVSEVQEVLYNKVGKSAEEYAKMTQVPAEQGGLEVQQPTATQVPTATTAPSGFIEDVKQQVPKPTPVSLAPAQPSELGTRATSAINTNQSLVGPSATVGGAAPVIVNNVSNIAGGSGGNVPIGPNATVRNEEPVLTRLQYQAVRPV